MVESSSLFNLINSNKEWLFSGVGVAFFAVAYKIYKFFCPSVPSSSVSSAQSSGDSSNNYMSAGNMSITNGLSTTAAVKLFSELSKKVDMGEQELVATRQSVKKSLMPYFMENIEIFNTYGPMTDDRFNPESSMPELWRRKIKDFILPNNKKIVDLIERSQHLLLDWEMEVFVKYKQHVDDFSAKHTGKTRANGVTFPKKILDILE